MVPPQKARGPSDSDSGARLRSENHAVTMTSRSIADDAYGRWEMGGQRGRHEGIGTRGLAVAYGATASCRRPSAVIYAGTSARVPLRVRILCAVLPDEKGAPIRGEWPR